MYILYMCCILYYVYKRMREHFRKPKEEDKSLAEVMYNAQQLEDYVRKKERTYWASYG